LLEADLNASRKAFDVATAAKANAEKLHKSVLAKAKRAEKALADANKEHLQREQAMAKRLNTMSAAAGCARCTLFVFLPLFDLLPCTFSDIFLSCYLSVTLLLQNIPRFRCRLRNPVMILF
jgi:hypothetical protein